MQMVCKTIKNK